MLLQPVLSGRFATTTTHLCSPGLQQGLFADNDMIILGFRQQIGTSAIVSHHLNGADLSERSAALVKTFDN